MKISKSVNPLEALRRKRWEKELRRRRLRRERRRKLAEGLTAAEERQQRLAAEKKSAEKVQAVEKHPGEPAGERISLWKKIILFLRKIFKRT